MKRKLLILIAAVSSVTMLWAVSAQAFNGRTGDQATVGKDETIDSSLYIAGKHVTIAGIVKGDVFCAGQNIEITGTVEGDVMCAGQEVRLSGTVEGDIRLAGQNVTVTGKIEDSATLLGQVVNIEDSAQIGRDLTTTAQTTRVGGAIGRDYVAAGDSVTIAGTIVREARLFTTTTILKSSAKVSGDLIYTSYNTAVLESGAQVKGTTQQLMPPQETKPEPSLWQRLIDPLFGLLVMVVGGGLLLLLMPKWFGAATKTMRKRPLASIGVGLAGIVCTPIIAGLLMVTVVGIPFGIVLLIIWMILAVMSFVFSAYSFGALIVQHLEWLDRSREFAALVIGVLVFAVAVQIPIVNFVVIIGGLFWGMGGIVWAIGHSIKQQRTPDKKLAKG